MSTSAKAEYILLFRGTDWHKGLSPEEIQEVVKDRQRFSRFELRRVGGSETGRAGMPVGAEPIGKERRVFARAGERLIVYLTRNQVAAHDTVAAHRLNSSTWRRNPGGWNIFSATSRERVGTGAADQENSGDRESSESSAH